MGRSAESEFRLGFFASLDLQGQGVVGGMLVTTPTGRPLEFQCSLPVKPNKTQEILYGPTLKPFVIGELIVKTLIDRLTVKPSLLLTQETEALSSAEVLGLPVVTFCDPEKATAQQFRTWKIESAPQQMAEQALQQLEELLPSNVDVTEPIERVIDALKETMSNTSAA